MVLKSDKEEQKHGRAAPCRRPPFVVFIQLIF